FIEKKIIKVGYMSFNQSKGEKNDFQYRKTGRSGNSANNNQRNSFQGSTGGGKGGGGNAPPPQSSSASLGSNRSFNKRSGNNGQGGGQSQSRVNVSNSYSEVNNTSSVARPGQNGAHVQPPLSGISDGPAPGVVTKPTTNPPAPRSARPAPKAPSSQSTTGIADSVAPSTPAKAEPKSFQLQFGSISPGVVNGMQIPARTSSAPPNLDEQKRDQARHDSVRAAPTMPITSGSKQQQPPKVAGSNKQSVTGEPHAAPSQARREVHAQVPPASGTTVSQKPSVLPIPGISMSVPFQSQVSVPFGGSISHIQSHGISTTSVPMPIPLPVGSAGQMPQQVFVPTHPLQTQGIIPQGPNLNFPTPIGHQMPPPIGNMGMGVSPQFPQQQAGKFGALRKTVKITHPETHEELKLDKRMDLYMDGASGPRSQPNAPPQSQPVPTFTTPHFNYYPPMQTNSYYFSSPQTAVPLPNTQMTTGPQATRYNNYSVGQGPPAVTYKNPASLNPLPSAKNGSQVHSSAEASNIEHAHDPQTVTVSTPLPSVQFTVKPAVVSVGTSSVTSSAPVIEKVESPKLLRAPKEGSTLQSHSAIASAAVSAPRLSTSISSSATASLSEESASVMTGPEGRPKEIIKRSESFKDRQNKGGRKDTRNAQIQNQEDTSPRLSRDVKKSSDTMQSPPSEMVESSSPFVSFPLQGLKHANSLNDGNSVEGHASLGTSGKTLVSSARPLADPSDSASNDIQNQDGDISRIASKETDLHSEGTILDSLDVSEHSKQELGEVQPKRECRTVEESTELIEGTKDSSNDLETLSEPTFSEGNRQLGVDCDVKDTTDGEETGSVGSEQKFEGVGHCDSEVERITDNFVNSSDSVDAQVAPSSCDSSTSSHDDSSSICNNHRDSQDPHADLNTVSSDVSLKDETKILESISGDLISTSVSVSKDKNTSETNRGKNNAAKVKKKRKDILKAADAAGSTSDLYMAYKGPEEKQENLAASENADNSSSFDFKQAPADDKEKDITTGEEDGQIKAEPDDWEDAADLSTPKLKPSGNQTEDGKNSKKYSRDFLLTLSEQCTDLPAGFEIGSDIAEALMSVQVGISHLVEREMYLNTGRIDRPSGGPRSDRRGSGMVEEDKWNKSPGSFISGRDPRLEVGHGGPVVGIRPGQGGNHGVLRNPRGQATGQYVSGILSGPMLSLASQGGMQRSHSDADRWQRAAGFHKGLIPSPQTPLQVMHKAEKKYEIRKVSDIEEAKQRQLKGILNKLTPQNFEKLFEQVKEVNIDNAVTLTGVISQIFDKALMEPTFCEMYANFCSHLAGELPDFSEDNEKITFKRLLLNKCQEEFERGEREQAEADRVEEEGEVKCSEEEREEKRIQARRRMLGNIRLIGELYKKRMLTERIMHECIKKLLGQHQNQNPDEEDVEALCKLMSTIGEMIDHPKAKEHMDAYFDKMLKFSNNMNVSSRVRFMLKDSIDLRKNKWQQRRKVEGPKKIDEVHRDAAQERHAQATRLARGPSMGSSARRGQPMDFSPRGSTVMTSPNAQMGSFRGYPSQARGYVQDVRMDERHSFESRTLSVPLSQRPLDDNSITLVPQGGLARGMSVRGQPLMSGVPLVDMIPVDPRRFAAGPNGYSSTLERTPYGREEALPRYLPERSIAMPAYEQSNLQERSAYFGSRDLRSSDRSLDRSMAASASHVLGASTVPLAHVAPEKNWPEERLRDMCFSAIREFYSAKDKEEVALCIKELNSPSFYPSMVSIWVTDSFERKDLERDLLAKLLVDLTKPRDSLLNPVQLIKGFESVLATLEDAVNDAPKAAEFLGRILAKVILENVVPLRDIGRLIHEGGEEPGRLLEIGLASEVLGSILEIIKSEKGDSGLNEIRTSSNLRLEDFRPPDPIKSRKLEAFF
ncbi:Eukaryotic translation initiation factor 4g like, partial [Thalictrum thalictroides]